MAGVLVNDGFPQSVGEHMWSVADIAGPASYVQLTTNPVGAGFLISAQKLGLPIGIVFAEARPTADGLYIVRVYLSPAEAGQMSSGIVTQWIVNSTGVEVAASTNLSGSTTRISAFGR
jgi:hypothetical protein